MPDGGLADEVEVEPLLARGASRLKMPKMGREGGDEANRNKIRLDRKTDQNVILRLIVSKHQPGLATRVSAPASPVIAEGATSS